MSIRPRFLESISEVRRSLEFEISTILCFWASSEQKVENDLRTFLETAPLRSINYWTASKTVQGVLNGNFTPFLPLFGFSSRLNFWLYYPYGNPICLRTFLTSSTEFSGNMARFWAVLYVNFPSKSKITSRVEPSSVFCLSCLMELIFTLVEIWCYLDAKSYVFSPLLSSSENTTMRGSSSELLSFLTTFYPLFGLIFA